MCEREDLRENPGIESPEVVVGKGAVFDQHQGVVLSGSDHGRDCRCKAEFYGEDEGECSVCPAKSYCEGGKSGVSCGEHSETSVPLSLSVSVARSLSLSTCERTPA